MKRLLLLRHAKADREGPSVRDIDRPLTARGERDAELMGRRLKATGTLPNYVLCSPALRARMTMELFMQAAGCQTKIQFEESIYSATSAELLKLVRALPDKVDCALMVGHNPGFEGLCGRLVGKYDSMPTAGLACIEFNITAWSDVEDGQGKLDWFIMPKDE